MTLDAQGNYNPWRQPAYGNDAQDRAVDAPEGYAIIEEGDAIPDVCAVYDVYAGWMFFPGKHYHSGRHTRSEGRWTTWASKKD